MSTDTTVIDKDIKTTIETTSSTNNNTKGQTMDKSTTIATIETAETMAAAIMTKPVIRMTDLTNVVNAWVESTFVDVPVMAQAYITYTDQVEQSKAQAAGHHAQVMANATKGVDALDKATKVIVASLKRVITAECIKGTNYIDRNAVAMQVGKKVSAKTFIGAKGIKVASGTQSKLQLGLNITEFLRLEGIIKTSSKRSKEGHTIVSIEAGFPIPKYIKELAREMRATRAETEEFIVNHTPQKAGGFIGDPKTMLNSKGFNSVATQPQLVCDALNKLQAIGYTLRAEVTSESLAPYSDNAKWYKFEDEHDKIGTFLPTELGKFGTDVSAFKDNVSHYAFAADDRGRLYSAATYLDIQGDSTQKSLIEFADKEVVLPKNLQYFKVAFAAECSIGDKCSVKEAIEQFDALSDSELDAIADAKDAHPSLRGVLNDYRKAVNGEAVGTILPWDATNQGAQVYSLLGRDIDGAKLTNITWSGKRQDAYGELADDLNLTLGSDTFNRDNLKGAFMVYLYGAGMETILNGKDAESRKKAIGSFFPADMSDNDKWSIFDNAMRKLLPAATHYMGLIYKYVSPTETKTAWTLPDGFKVETTASKAIEVTSEYVKIATKRDAAHIAEGSITTRVEQANPFSKSLAPNIIHSIDSYIMREVIRRADFAITTVHDSYGVHANNVDAVRALYREVLADVMEMDLLEDILAQINPSLTASIIRRGGFTKGELTRDNIINSKYALR